MKKILVIEDEAETLENLVLMLEMEGFKPFSAANGRAGVAVAKRELPDVILCDVTMPEMDGYGVLENLRAGNQQAQINAIRTHDATTMKDGGSNGLIPAS